MYHIKYRPKKFSEFFGNGEIVYVIKKLLKSGKLPQAMLFYGKSGVGKTTMARIIADKLGCVGDGYIELNNANMRGIDTMRTLIDVVQRPGLSGNRKVVVLDEFHQATVDAQNALLKMLEDIVPDVYFIICTTNVEGIISTVRTRCMEFRFRPLGFDELRDLCAYVMGEEKIDVNDSVIDLLVRAADGSARKLLVDLYKVKDIEVKTKDDLISVKRLISVIDEDIDGSIGKWFKMLVVSDEWDSIVKSVNDMISEFDDAVALVKVMCKYAGAVMCSSSIDDFEFSVAKYVIDKLVKFRVNDIDVLKSVLLSLCYDILIMKDR